MMLQAYAALSLLKRRNLDFSGHDIVVLDWKGSVLDYCCQTTILCEHEVHDYQKRKIVNDCAFNTVCQQTMHFSKPATSRRNRCDAASHSTQAFSLRTYTLGLLTKTV